MHKAKRTGQSTPAKKRPMVASNRPVDHRPPTGGIGGIASALRKAITKSGLTHYALGKKANCSPSQIDRFISEERSLSLECVDRIALALGIEVILKG